jgi:hypothetical protein
MNLTEAERILRTLAAQAATTAAANAEVDAYVRGQMLASLGTE